MGFWLALYSTPHSLIQVSNTSSSPALSLLGDLLQEPLGHRLPLPHVPRFSRYAFEFSKNRRRHSGLTSVICSYGYHIHLPERVKLCQRVVRSSILFDLAFTQRHPHPDDRHPDRAASQERSRRPGDNRNRWIVQCCYHHAHRVLCPLRCELAAGYWSMGRWKPHYEFLLVHLPSDSGPCFRTTAIFR